MKTIRISHLVTVSIILLMCFTLIGCAEPQHVEKCVTGHTYGFWGGLWHGIIAPFAFIGSLFSDDIVVWSPNNNGGWYTFGFLIGAGSLFGGGSASSSK